MRNSLASINILLHDPVLVNTYSRQNVENILITGLNAIKDKANHDLLPCRTPLAPELRFLEVHDISDILHNTV